MRLSHSQLDTYRLCGHKWKLKYVDKLYPTSIGSALFFGNAVGKVWAQQTLCKKINLTEEEKILIQKDPYEYFDELFQTIDINGEVQSLPTCINVTYYKGDYDAELLTEQDIELINNYRKSNGFNDVGFEDLYSYYKAGQADEDEIKFLNLMFWVACRRRAHYLIKAYQIDVIPRILRVYSIEEPISIPNGAGDIIVGFIDIIADIALDPDENGKVEVVKAVLDNKTSSTKYSVKKFSESGQLHLYNYVKELGHIGYIVGVKKIKNPKIGKRKGEIHAEIQIITQPVNPEQEEKFIQETDLILKLMKEENCPKNKDACLAFGRRCDYYELCMGDGSMKGLIKK
jgi:hypothetical protein